MANLVHMPLKVALAKFFIVQVGWSTDIATDIALNYANDFCSHYKFMKFFKFEFKMNKFENFLEFLSILFFILFGIEIIVCKIEAR